MTALSNPIEDRDQHDTHTPSNGQIVTGDKIAPVELDPSLADTDTSNHHRQSSEERHPDESNGDGTMEKVATGASLGRVPSQAQKLGKKKIVVVMAALCLVLFLAALDMTIISTALPTMASHFNASESGYSWMASSYMLANAAAVPLWGKISDIWGRKRILLLANFTFLVGSLICALAINLPMILVGRAIQGVGGGGIIVLVNICVSDLFSVRERPMYYGLFGSTWAIAGALGPIVGGAFTTNVTWRWCFYINLPIGGVSFVILVLFLKIEAEKTPLLAGLKAIDWIGIVLIMGGTLMFLFGLEYGGITYPWDSATVICLIVFGVVAWAIAMVVEWKVAKYPVIPIRLFTNWHNILVLLVCFCHSFVFIAGSYYLPLYFQTVLLANPIMSGVYVLPNVLSLSFTSACTGFIIKKTGRYRELIVGGLFFMTLGYGLLIDLKYYASWPRIIIYQLIAGFGSGPVFQAPLVALQANIHRGDVAAGTSTFGFLRQTSAAMSIVLGTVVYQNVLRQQMPKISTAIGPEKATALASSFSGSQGDLIRALPGAQKNVVLKSYTFTLSRMWIFYTAIIGFGLLVSLLIRPVVLSKAHTFTKTGLAEQERARQEILAAQRGETQPESKETV
ncbi:major facilitator superfamily domain-containing protein [Aspergillus pseudotamarii]|uniref:Efflux pump dotC n=1 Tax=Aspergillus pseudotamarii TaxID=132259 RepID=A0A5N6SHK6_ASPPS|nr:major facilitator superfamily domain-containing protein [Aspergillus pseudotamarii]KAE8134198.1 major facilitator superfamily domain-containing protein [Aspergillus pseudotamarii]